MTKRDQAEIAILGRFIVSPDTIDRNIGEEHFGNETTKAVYRGILKCEEGGIPVNLATVSDATGLAIDVIAGMCDYPMAREQMPKMLAKMFSDHELSEKRKKIRAKAASERPEDALAELQDVDLFGITRRIRPAKESEKLPQRFIDELPGLIGMAYRDFMETAHKPQPILALGAAICLQAVVCSRRVIDESGTTPNIYAAGIAESSAGKDHARQRIKMILAKADMSNLQAEGVKSAPGLVNALIQDPALLLQIDEYGKFLKICQDSRSAPHLYEVVTVLTKLYTSASGTFQSDRYADVRATASGKNIENPHVSVWGTSVPRHFFESLTLDAVEDGFIGRNLIFSSREHPDREIVRFGEPAQEIVDEVARWRTSISCGAFAGKMRVVEHDAGGAAIREEYRQKENATRKKSGAWSPIWGRSGAMGAKLALIYAAAANPDAPTINASAARWGYDLVEWLTHDLIRLCAENLASNPFHRQCLEAIAAVRRHGGEARRTELADALKIKKKDLDTVLETLIDSGRLMVRRDASRGGRPAEIYSVEE